MPARAIASLLILLSTLAPAASRAEEALELRVPASVLRQLAQPDSGRPLEISRALLRANPWAKSANAGGDLTRFWISWRLPDTAVPGPQSLFVGWSGECE